MPDAFVAGAAVTRFGRHQGSYADLAREAGAAALAEAGASTVDHVFVASHDPSGFVAEAHVSSLVTTALGLNDAGATHVATGPSSGASALAAASWAVKSGAVASALVVGVEKMTGHGRDATTALLARMLAADERAAGWTMPRFAAQLAATYMERFGVTRDALAEVPVKAHAHGLRNADAHFQRAVTVADVTSARVVAAPLTVLDCAPVSDGAAAVVLTARPGPVRVLATGHATAGHAVLQRPADDRVGFRATRVAAARALRAAGGLTVADVEVAELHDAFSVLEAVTLEDLGVVPPGDGVAATARGETSLGGRFPVNVGGGLKARGHPVGASGVAQIVELTRHLTGSAGARQVDGAKRGLAQSVGGFGSNVVVSLLEAT